MNAGHCNHSDGPAVMPLVTENPSPTLLMKINHLMLAGLLCGAPLAVSAQVRFGVGVNFGPPVPEPPPQAFVENVGPAPMPGYVWVSGQWVWHHGRWMRTRGHWAYRPGFVWQPGAWQQANGGWVWVEGQWVPAAPMVASQPPPPASDVVVVESAPPPPLLETYGPAPGPDYFWIGGRWGWYGGRWSWVGGRWDRHPHWHPGGGWVPGHWDHRGHGYAWVEGRWR